jgi:hypothetical protein
MANYSSDLEALTLRRFIDKKVGKSIYGSTAVMNKLYENRETGDGAQWEKAINLHVLTTAKNFEVFDGSTDSYTANDVNNVDNLIFRYKHTGDALKVSELKVKQNAGPSGKIKIVDEAIDSLVESLKQKVSDNVHTGDNSGANPSGFANQFAITGTYGGITRADAPALVPHILYADRVSADYSTGTVTATNGSTAIVGSGTAFTTGSPHNVRAGAVMYITDGAGTVHEHYVASVTDGTNLVLATKYRGTTAAGLSYVAKNPLADTTFYGASGVFTLEKISAGFALASNAGEDLPDLGMCRSNMFERFERELRIKNLYTVEASDPGIKAYRNFKYNGMNVVVDPKVPAGTFRAINTKHCKWVFLDGYDKFDLAPDENGKRMSRVTATSGASFVTLVGQVVLSNNMANWALNRCFEVRNITV